MKDSFETVIKQATTDDCSIAIVMKDDQTFGGYRKLEMTEKEKLLGIKGKCSGNKRMKRYDVLLEKMQTPCNIIVLGKAIHLKPKYTKKYVDKLLNKNLIVKRNGQYKTAVIMEK